MTTAQRVPGTRLEEVGGSPTLLRCEEQLQVGVRTQAVRRLRIRRQVVAEEVTRTVTVRRVEGSARVTEVVRRKRVDLEQDPRR